MRLEDGATWARGFIRGRHGGRKGVAEMENWRDALERLAATLTDPPSVVLEEGDCVNLIDPKTGKGVKFKVSVFSKGRE